MPRPPVAHTKPQSLVSKPARQALFVDYGSCYSKMDLKNAPP